MKIILHIGTEKTGTTSIQNALAMDRERLGKQGILFPRLFGSENHMELSVYAMEDGVNDELRQQELAKSNCCLDDYRSRLISQLRAEVKESNCNVLLLSNEHCHSRLNSLSAINRLYNLLSEFSDNIEILVYLRRQDRLALSVHSTRVKLGGIGRALPTISQQSLPYYFDFWNLLKSYRSVFGHGTIRVAIFEPNFLLNGDVVEDFYNFANLCSPAPKLGKANESLSGKQQIFLEEFNEYFPLFKDGKINALRGPIFSVISDTLPGRPIRPARAEALSFYDHFREGNENVKNTFFPNLDRDTLFDEDFDDYPEIGDSVTLTKDDMFQFISAIWRYAQFMRPRNS